MQVNADLYILELPLMGRIMNLSLIVDGDNLTLVDTGLPDQADLIAAAIKETGHSIENLKQIIITHQDVDHIGSAQALKTMTGAKILSLAIEAPYIDGTTPLQKTPTPERLAANPGFAVMWANLQYPKVDERLEDGQVLAIAGGVRVIATPGHSVGHLSLYLERTKTLITGDAMVSAEGKLEGPSEGATPDMESARQSVKKLAELDVETIVCYHGGLVTDNASGQLQEVAS